MARVTVINALSTPRADEPGVVIVFECERFEQCKRDTDDFPLTKAGFIEWFHLPVQVALPLKALFRAEIDVRDPYDRTTSAFAATPLNIVLRDCGIGSFAIVGIALEIGIEPTGRHAMDLAYIPVIITDACGSGNQIAADRSLASLATFGGSLRTDTMAINPLLRRASAPLEPN